MRYTLYAVLCAIGLAVGMAGMVDLGIGAVYGGAFLAILSAVVGYADYLERDDPRAR